MGAFEYQALDAKGKQQKGVIEGDSARQIRQKIRDQGWIPVSVDAVAEGKASPGDKATPGKRGRIQRAGASTSEVMLVTRQLATLVGSGLPLEEALQVCAQHSEKVRVKNMMAAVRSRVLEGRSLAVALGSFPRAFPEMYQATVAAGEQTGNLDVVLERLADYSERRQEIRQKVQLALFYPAILLLVALTIVGFMLTFVVPKVTRIFENTGQELPVLTQIMIGLSEFLQAWWWLLIAGAIAGAVAFAYGMRSKPFRRRVHAMLLRLPVIGRLNRSINAGRFARTFSILLGSGVPALEALKIASEVITNLPMREAVDDATSQVREGASISKSMERSGQFPPLMLYLIASGERSGELENMLERSANSQEREVENAIASFLALFEPLIIVFLGGLVMMIVLSILLPIFQMNQLVS